MLRKQIDYDIQRGVESVQWHNYIFPILLTYNNKNEHTSTGLTPTESTKQDNQLDVKPSLEMKATRNRKYPDLVIGDKVKMMLKYDKFNKEHTPTYSD